MTPTQARRYAKAWLIVALLVFAGRVVMRFVTGDWSWVPPGTETICIGLSLYHSGWLRGHREVLPPGRAGEHVEAIGLLGCVRHLRRNGEDEFTTWAEFDRLADDFMRRRQEVA